jgi:trk system potassium uptake protein TrkH
LIALGTLGLVYLPGLYVGQSLGWQDALFTSTSAVCVTGLTVVDTATYFTPLGQAFILLLIQLGGLGMLAYTSMIILAIGGRISVRTESLSAGSTNAVPQIDGKRLAVDVVKFTLILEALGALALYLLWAPRYGWRESLWPAIFHSISSYCNAGFSTYSDSLIGFHDSPATLVVISSLIIAGGIGFLTMEEIYLHSFRKNWSKKNRFSLHSRLVLWTTAILLFGGTLLFALFEWNNTFSRMSLHDRLCNSFFLSVTARTAGFNTIDYAQASDSANFLTIILMTIGGSPGSTSGGLKTTTFALIGLLAWTRLRSAETTSLAGRSIPDETIQRAVGLLVVAVAVIAIGVFTLAITEAANDSPARFLRCVFESVSAFSTVGLSMGFTSELSPGGRIAVTLLMFLGRVGTLSVAAALVIRRPRKVRFRYASEDVVVG